jgi:hypothetical protein
VRSSKAVNSPRCRPPAIDFYILLYFYFLPFAFWLLAFGFWLLGIIINIFKDQKVFIELDF